VGECKVLRDDEKGTLFWLWRTGPPQQRLSQQRKESDDQHPEDPYERHPEENGSQGAIHTRARAYGLDGSRREGRIFQ
jgi:hypothetical protein